MISPSSGVIGVVTAHLLLGRLNILTEHSGFSLLKLLCCCVSCLDVKMVFGL